MSGLEVVVFVGLQASGKSSFYRERFASTHALVSKDLYRNVRNKERRQRREVTEALAAGKSVVVDNTNPSAEARAPLLALARQAGARAVAYCFASDVGDCLRRNAAREGEARVPVVGVLATAKQLAPPGLDEGFDERWSVRLIEGGGFAVERIDEAPT